MSDRDTGEAGESVGRYVRERWGAAAESPRARRRSRRSDDAERAPSDGPTGASTATRTPPDGIAWGADLPDVDDDLFLLTAFSFRLPMNF